MSLVLLLVYWRTYNWKSLIKNGAVRSQRFQSYFATGGSTVEALSRQQQNQLQPQAPFVLGQLGGSDPEEEKFDFWGVLNRRKWLVFLGLITGLGLAGLYYAQTDTIYRSEARVKIEPKDPLMMDFSGSKRFAPGSELLSYRHDRFIAQPNIVQSCLEKFRLYTLKSFEELVEEDVVQDVLDNMVVVPDPEEHFIYVMKYNSREKEDAKTILNNIIRTYKENLDDQYRDEYQKYIVLLTDVRREFEADYAKKDQELEVLVSMNNGTRIDPAGRNIHQIMVSNLLKELETAKDEFNTHLRRKELSEEALGRDAEACRDLVWQFNQDGVLSTQSTEIADIKVRNTEHIKRRIQELETQYLTLIERLGPGNPTMIAIAKQVDGWKKYLFELTNEVSDQTTGGIPDNEVLRRLVASIGPKMLVLQTKIQADQELYEEHLTEARRLTTVQQQIERVEHDREYIESLVKETHRKIVEIDSSGRLDNVRAQEGFNFQVLMDASKGDVVWPELHIVLPIGGLLGLLAGFGLGCLVEIADKTFHNPDEIMKQLNLPLIGHIPVISQSKRYVVENSDIDPIVCCYHRPKSQVSEAFRAVRTALYFNTQGQAHQVIQVTSPTPGDGKSTLASNLTVSIAQSGKRVLLVDADMRRPRQHVTFGVTSNEGFATVLSGMSNWRDVIFNCDEIEGLSVMPCGAKPQNPAELSTSPQVKELIDEMREEFDFVVIDTPPLLAVTDPCPIAARVDGVILTLRIKKNVRVSAERATDILRNLGTHVFGLVVNGVGAQTGYGSQYTYGAYRAGYAYNGYGYGYGYGNGQGNKYYDEDKPGRRNATTPNIEAQPASPGQELPG